MQRIINHRKLLNITPDADLAKLKVTYRNLIKEWHPDKFQDHTEKETAEHKSKAIIEAYHFMVSVSPETHAQNTEQYGISTASGVTDFVYKSKTLKITYNDGSIYEYFGVPKSVYNKLINASSLGRFVKRHISDEYTFRNASKASVAL
jgi:DnaJ-class molecular chaperone